MEIFTGPGCIWELGFYLLQVRIYNIWSFLGHIFIVFIIHDFADVRNSTQAITRELYYTTACNIHPRYKYFLPHSCFHLRHKISHEDFLGAHRFKARYGILVPSHCTFSLNLNVKNVF